MSECLCENGKLPLYETFAKHNDNGSILGERQRAIEHRVRAEHKQRGRSGGGKPDRPEGCWKGLVRAGGVTQPAQTSLAAWQWHAARSGGRALR